MSKYIRDYYMPGEFMTYDAAWTDMEEQMTLGDFSEYFPVSYDRLLEWAMKQENFFTDFTDEYAQAEQDYFRDYYHEVKDEEAENHNDTYNTYYKSRWPNE